MTTLPHPPLILTLQIDEESFTFFNNLRKQHFPPERNFLAAHLTLFHHLPNNTDVVNTIAAMAAQTAPIPLAVSAVSFMGRGVAYKIESKTLVTLHKKMQQQWKPLLTPQDAQGLWPHVTVQNKVTPETAKALQQQLAATFIPFIATGTGFSLFSYKGGPWEKIADYPFTNTESNVDLAT